jgi:hypothetical protein
MPDGISDSGDVLSAGVSTTGGPVLQGYVQTYATDAGNTGIPANIDGSETLGGTPLFNAGIDTTVLTGGISIDSFLPDPTGAIRTGASSFGGGGSPFQAGANKTVVNAQTTTQVVKMDISNTVVQPLEPCRSVPYLKLVFLPVDPEVKFNRDLRRETSIPVPKQQQMTVAEYKAAFDGKVHIKDLKYLLRWKQILPVVIEPQDSNAVDYKSVDVYDLRTSILINDQQLLAYIDISELPLTQITVAQDLFGGTTNEEVQDYELYLDTILFADVDQSTGHLVGKDPVDAGIFTA